MQFNREEIKMFGYTGTSRTLHMHAVKIMLGLFLVFTVLPSFAQHPRITQLIAEKQAKMEKLEKCQGTTKNLKIAGISTLGITAVGIGANIAEAVVLKDTKEKVKEAEKKRDEQQKIKDERLAQQKKQECEKDSTKYWTIDGYCNCKPGYIDNGLGSCALPQTAQSNSTTPTGTNAVATKNEKDGAVDAVTTEAKVENITAFKNVRLDNIDQIQRLFIVTNLITGPYGCKVESAGKGQRQDFVRCEEEEDGIVRIVEFDNIIKDNNKPGDVEKSLSQYFCGTEKPELMTISCKDNVEYVMYGGSKPKEEKSVETKTKIDSRYSEVQLHDLDQAKRLFGADNLSSDACSSNVRTERNQDFLKCGDTEYEFDDLSDGSNGEGGRVYTSLQKYFCGNTGASVENNPCMDKVVKVWGGTRKEPKVEKKEENDKKGNKDKDPKQACEELEGFAVWEDDKCKYAGDECTTILGGGVGVYEQTNDGLKCKISRCKLPGFDINVKNGGYSCTGLASEKAAGVQKAKDKQACEELEGFAVWEDGKCKYAGDECTTILGGGVGVYEQTDDGLKCKISRCKLPGFDINVKNGGYSCTGLASEKAPKKVEETQKKEEPKPIVLKSSAKEECERDGNHLWLNGKECKGVGEVCSVLVGGGVGTYKRVGGEIKCVLDTCNNRGYVVADDKLSCKSASFNAAVVASVAVSAKEEPKVEPEKVEPKAEPKKEEPRHDWTVPADARYDNGYVGDRDSAVYFVGDKMMKIDNNFRPTEVDNLNNIKKREEEEKLKKQQAEREAKAQKQAEFERQQAEQKRDREERQKRLNDLCSKAGCGADCLVDSLGSGKVKVHCSGIEKYYDANSNEIAKP